MKAKDRIVDVFLTSLLTMKMCRCLSQCLKTVETTKNGNNISLKPPWNVLFFGSDQFSLESLQLLHSKQVTSNLLDKLEVVTSKTKKINPIEKFATASKLIQYSWPPFIDYNTYHIGIVVSFGHLIPRDMIEKFPMGMINVHGSLLPRWRGATPIVHTLINGDEETGVTVMQIKPDKFDTGDILLQKTIPISNHIRMPELYSQMAKLGAEALVETLELLPNILKGAIEQPAKGVTYAPKIDAKMLQVCWAKSTAAHVYNLGRAFDGLHPLVAVFQNTPVKLYNVNRCDKLSTEIVPGLIVYNKHRNLLEIQCSDGGWVTVGKIGLSEKKVMSASDFKNGYMKSKELKFILR